MGRLSLARQLAIFRHKRVVLQCLWKVSGVHCFDSTAFRQSLFSTCTVPAVWGTATIEPSISSQPTEGYEYTYLCSIVLRDGIVGTAGLVWVGPDGDPVVTGSNVAVGRAETEGGKTSLLLSFLPLSSTHGGNYSCNVSVLVLYVNVTVSEVVRTTLIITCKSYDLCKCTCDIMLLSIHLSICMSVHCSSAHHYI